MTLNRSLFFSIVGLLFAVLFIPLFVNNSLFFPFITGKNFAFRIIVEVALLLWVILVMRDKTYRPKFSWVFVAVAVFVAIVGVADMLGTNPVKSFLSNYERMEGWINLAHQLAYFTLLISVLRGWDLWKRFFQTSVGVSAIIAIHGFMQLAGAAQIHQSTSRLDASFGNATYLAVYMLFHFFITLILLTRYLKENGFKTKWYKDMVVYVYGGMMVVQTIILFFTATRGSILALIAGLIVSALFIAFTEREHRAIRKVAIGVLAVIMVLIVAFLLAKDTAFVRNNEVLGRLASISATDNTTKARFLIWNMAWKGATEDPKHFLIGWGQENFNYVFNKYYDPKMYAQEQWFDRSHNVIFDWLTAAGVLGLLAYLSMYGLALYGIWRKSHFSRLEKSILTGLFAGYFVHNLFVFDHLVSYILFFTFLAYVHVGRSGAVVTESPEYQKDENEASLAFHYSAMIIAGVVIIGIFYQYTYKPLAANTLLISAISQRQMLSASSTRSYVYVQENVDAFKKVIGANTIGLYEAREQLFDIAVKAVNSNSEDRVKQGLVTLAQTEVLRQIDETPEDVRYYLLGGNFLQNIGDYKNAASLLTKAAELSPKKQSLLFVLGSNYFALKQYTEALAVFKKAYELEPTFEEAKKLYGLVALYVGQEKVTTELFGPGPVMDTRFLAAYRSAKKYDLMIAYLTKQVEAVATSDRDGQIKTRLSLGAGYMETGNPTAAIRTLEQIKIVVSDAEVKTQIDQLIKEVRAGKNPLEKAL